MTTKLLYPDILAEMRSRCQLFRFDGVDGITSDITNMEPEKAAEALAREVMRMTVAHDGSERYRLPRPVMSIKQAFL